MNSISDSASDHLRVIRSLMERATVYRAISAPAALFGGLLAVAAGAYLAWKPEVSGWAFFGIWVGILALVGGYNGLLLWKQAIARAEPFVSSGMRLALRAIVPPMLAGGLVSHFILANGGSVTWCVAFWILFYGLALVATGGFAPGSMRVLGMVFFVTGVALLVTSYFVEIPTQLADVRAGAILMAATFGVFHLVYALKIFCSSEDDQSEIESGPEVPADGAAHD